MAFFGLTALGPQNEFKASSKYRTYLNIFTENDYTVVWKRTVGEEKHCLSNKIPSMFKTLYKGPLPQNDQDSVNDAIVEMNIDMSEGGTISHFQFISLGNKLKNDAIKMEIDIDSSPMKPTCEFNSTSEYALVLRKNGKIDKTLHTKQNAPMTQSQVYGWEKGELVVPTTGRKQTNVTKFAAELIKSGVYF